MRPLVALALALFAGGCQDGTGTLVVTLNSTQPLRMVALLRATLAHESGSTKTADFPAPDKPVDIGPNSKTLVLVTPRGRSGSALLEVTALTPLMPGKDPTEVIGIAKQMITLKPGATTNVTLRFGEIAIGGDMAMPPPDLSMPPPDLTVSPELGPPPDLAVAQDLAQTGARTCMTENECGSTPPCDKKGCACFAPMNMGNKLCVPKCESINDCPPKAKGCDTVPESPNVKICLL